MQKTFFLIVVLLSVPALAIDAETGAQYAAKGDYATAYNIWKVFAEEGDPLSQFYLGVLYEKGSGVEKDYPQALFWYIKSAEQGVAKASYNIGNMFFNGRGVSRDYKEAERRFRLAAELNYPPAQYNLAYTLDKSLNGEKNPTEVFNWYLKAAKNGVQKAKSKVGKMYEVGIGAAQDKEKAIYWYEKVVSKDPEIRIRLAKLYLDDQNRVEEGIRLLRSSAENGDKLAQYQLGYLYGQGEKVKQDYEQATFWYKRAAKQQVPEAQYLLCLSYSLGKGVPVDMAVAQAWCEAAVINKAEGAEEALKEIKESR